MIRRIVCGCLAAALTAGCSTMRVETDYLEGEDFTIFDTFRFRETDISIADVNPIAHRRIIAGIKREMTASGFRETDSNPDLYVTYYGRLDEQVVLDTVRMGYDYGYPWRWGGHPWAWGADPWYGSRRPWGNGYSQSTTRAITYREGTLVIDVWAAQRNELLWRGVVSDTIDGELVLSADQINRGIERVFQNFPPASRPQ